MGRIAIDRRVTGAVQVINSITQLGDFSMFSSVRDASADSGHRVSSAAIRFDKIVYRYSVKPPSEPVCPLSPLPPPSVLHTIRYKPIFHRKLDRLQPVFKNTFLRNIFLASKTLKFDYFTDLSLLTACFHSSSPDIYQIVSLH